ncbi:MAG TPA: hypothetical protein VJ623_03905 [Holophagaceae bacterium]|nr:hypothetical protein [Holophagaceae bacterium]
MRTFLLLAALPLLAAPQPKPQPKPKAKAVKVLLSEAVVTWGAGREPKGPMPPAAFSAKVAMTGLKAGAKAELRAWRMLVSDLPALAEGAQLRFVRGGLGRLEAQATETGPGTWTLRGTWPGAPEAEERLVVEVWLGGRRVGYAVAPVAEHLRPVGRPQGDQGKE